MTSRGRRRFWFIVFAVGVYAAIGFFVLPTLVKAPIERRLSAELQRRVGVGAVRINPFALSIALERVEVLAPGGTDPFVGWRRLEVSFDPLQSFRREWVLGEIVLEDFYGAVEVQEDGRLNFDDLIGKFSEHRERAAERREQSWPWRVGRLTVSGARIDLVDRSRSEVFRSLIGPVNFTLVDFRTAGGTGAPYRFEAKTESGERLTWSGTLTAKPFASVGEWRIENLLLSKYAPYFDERMTVLLTSGKLTMSGRYDASFAPDDRRLVFSDGTAQLEKLKLLDPATGEQMLEFGAAEITGAGADLLAKRIQLGRLQVADGRLTMRRDPEGVVNVLALFKPHPRETARGRPARLATAGEPKPFEFSAGEVAVRDFSVEVNDRSAARPVQFELTRADLTLKEFTTARGAAVPFELTFGMSPQGTARVTGDFGLRPWRTNADLELAWIGLAPFSPYFERRVQARLARGSASLKGRLVLATDRESPDVTFTGSGRVEEAAIVGKAEDGELAGFSNLAFNEITVATVPRLTLHVPSLTVNGPYVHFVVDESGRSNFAQLAGVPAPAGVVLPGVGAELARPATHDVTIGRVTIDGGDVTFTDRSLQPVVQVAVRQIGGTLQNLSSRNPARGELELRGLVEGESPLIAKGRFNPLGANVVADLQFDGRAIGLRPIAPYVARFSGYEFAGGTLFLEAEAKLVEQKLDLRSKLTLEDFALGEPAPNPGTLNLPVKLGVALLKDADGKIVIDVPVEGSMADPQFSVAGVVGQVLTSTLAKAATSPFALLGAMFGGGGEELSHQEFALGEADPTPESRQRLVTLQRALVSRPALMLELDPGFDPGELNELKRRRLESTIRQRVWEKLRRTDASTPPMDQLLVSSRHRADMITEMFDEQFTLPRLARGARAERQAPVRELPPAPPPVAAPAPNVEPEPPEKEERRGLFRRAMDVATLKGVREKIWGDDEEPNGSEPPPSNPAPAELPPAPAPALEAPVSEPRELLNLPLDEMEQRLLAAMPAGPDDLRQLAEARARRVKQLLVESGDVAPERIQIAEVGDDAGKKGARVMLQLR
jgi:uncharacterized protein involved in outer membrane biogenesis